MNFNIKFDNKFIQTLLKYILIVLIGFFILYFLDHFFYKTYENFSNFCNKCQMKPTSGNCVKLSRFDISNAQDVSFIIGVSSDFIFCPWEPNCTNDDYLNNLRDLNLRQGITNQEISDNYLQGTTNVTCCSGTQYSEYNNYTISFGDVSINKSNIQTCSTNNINTSDLFCRGLNAKLNDKGMVFRVDICNVLTNTKTFTYDLKNQEIFNLQNIRDISVTDPFTDTNRYIQNIQELNNLLSVNRYPSTSINIYTDNSSNPTNISFQTRNKIIDKLNTYYKPIVDEVYEYQLLNRNDQAIGTSTNTNNQYLLNENEFFDCFVNKKQVREASGNQFTRAQITDFCNNNFFDIGPGATYKTSQEVTPINYGPSMDLEMELKNLPSVEQTGNAPVSVINQYLNAINGFYEKQLANIMGPKTHGFNQELEFDNNTLETKEKTFFVYEQDKNNEYECQPSITGNKKFEYCGPDANYTPFIP